MILCLDFELKENFSITIQLFRCEKVIYRHIRTLLH